MEIKLDKQHPFILAWGWPANKTRRQQRPNENFMNFNNVFGIDNS